MQNPFFYAKTRHSRTRTPAQYRNYKQYKPDLKAEFAGQCVYCRAIDRIKGDEGFGVDHYMPQKLFPHLATEYANLFYACNRCNSWKGSYWPAPAQRKVERYIPNPCEHAMFEHMRYDDGSVRATSAPGAFTVGHLDLNDPQAIRLRRFLVDAAQAGQATITALEGTIAQAQKLSAAAATSAEKARIDGEIVSAAAVLQRARDDVKLILG